MNYIIQVGENKYEVIVDDINKRPIIAHVDGREFQVTPIIDTSVIETIQNPETQVSTLFNNSAFPEGTLTAPLPGTIIEIFVKDGDKVETGQVILIIEAMKMKNNIRSTKDGTIASVLVSAGQTVAHKQVLVEFK